MTSRININRVPQSYPAPTYEAPRSRSYADTSSGSFQDDPLSKLRTLSTKVEDYIDIYSQPLRPHLPAIGRFLIVVTFLEDALRITTQWKDQLWYLQRCVSCVTSLRPVVRNGTNLPYPLTDIVHSPGALVTCSCSSTSSYVSFLFLSWNR